MRIFSINGSPHGREGRTELLVRAFLDGAREAGAETSELFLSDRRIEYCRGCHSCWSRPGGGCVIEDDFAGAFGGMAGSDLIVFATPLHFVHASGQLKTFLDRLSSMGGNPHDPPKTPAQEPRPAGSAGRAAGPRLALVASCGHPRPAQFRSLSLWMEDLASLLGMGLFMEALVASASRLVSTAPEDLAAVEGYRGLLRAAGGAAARGEDLAPSLRQALKGGL